MVFLRMIIGWLLQVAPPAFLCFQPFGRQLRFSKKKTAVITLGLLLTTGSISALVCLQLLQSHTPSEHLFEIANTIFMAGFIPCLLWYLYAVTAVWPQKIFIFFYAFSVALVAAFICNPIITWLSNGILLDYFVYDGLLYAGISIPVYFLVSVILYPVSSWILTQYTTASLVELSQKGSIAITVLSIILVLFQGIVLTYLSLRQTSAPAIFCLYIMLLMSVFIIYAFFFRMLRFTYEKLEAQRRYNDIKHQLSLESEQYRRINDSIKSARRMRHDLRHHMVTILGYLQENDTESATDYLNRFLQTAGEHQIPYLCDNTVINTLAGHYQILCREQNVDFSVHIAVPAEITVQDIDLSVLIGNLLENALDAVLSVSDGVRYIRFHMACSGKMLVVTVDNNFCGAVKTAHGEYLSTKENHSGQGLSSVRMIAEKYSGGVEFSHSGTVFHASVMLAL